jgi:hypothetical protein
MSRLNAFTHYSGFRCVFLLRNPLRFSAPESAAICHAHFNGVQCGTAGDLPIISRLQQHYWLARIAARHITAPVTAENPPGGYRRFPLQTQLRIRRRFASMCGIKNHCRFCANSSSEFRSGKTQRNPL